MRPSRPVAPRAGSAPSRGAARYRRCGPPQRRDASAVPPAGTGRPRRAPAAPAPSAAARRPRRTGGPRRAPATGRPSGSTRARSARRPATCIARRLPSTLTVKSSVSTQARPGPLPHEALDVRALVGPQPPLGPARHLRGEHAAPPGQQGAALPARVAHHRAPHGQRVRRAEHRERGDQAGVQCGDRPPDHAAPAVADDPRRRFAERADQAGDVAGERPQVVAARGLVRVAVAAQVHGDGAEARVRERGQLAPPGPPELGEAVQQHDERCTRVAALREVQADAVRGDVAVLPRPGEPDRRGVGGRAGHRRRSTASGSGQRADALGASSSGGPSGRPRCCSMSADSRRLSIVRSGLRILRTFR